MVKSPLPAGFPEGLIRPAVYGWGVRSPTLSARLSGPLIQRLQPQEGFVIDEGGNLEGQHGTHRLIEKLERIDPETDG